MPLYEFKMDGGDGTKNAGSEVRERFLADLTIKELDVYERIMKVTGGIIDLSDTDDEIYSLYMLVTEGINKKNKDKEMNPVSLDDFTTAYTHMLERKIVYPDGNGDYLVCQRLFSVPSVHFHGDGFYSTDSKKGN